MNLLYLLKTPIRRVSTNKGGEYAGPCPLCGDGGKGGNSDRFHVWPNQGDSGSWWCRRCNRGGDAIQYLREVEGMTYREACEALGVDSLREKRPPEMAYKRPEFSPRACDMAGEVWQAHAAKLVAYAHQCLLDCGQQMAWLQARGIGRESVLRHQLGWLGTDYYRQRAAWGLPEELKADGKPKKLWLPMGVTIPCFDQHGSLQRVRIRRPEGDPRYFLVPGSSTLCMIIGEGSIAVVVESELDAITLAGVAPDGFVVVAMGNSSAKPDQGADRVLRSCRKILVALDSDEAGARAAAKWRQWYPDTTTRWPMIGGKDPGEAYAAGVDLRVWLEAGAV